MTLKYFILTLTFAFTLTVINVSGQIPYGMYDNSAVQRSMNMQSIITNNAISNIMMNGALKGSSSSANQNKSGGKPGTANRKNNRPNSPAGNSRSVIFFTPTGKSLMAKDVAKAVSDNSAGTGKAEEFLVKGLDYYQKILDDKGYAHNDVARSVSSLMIICLALNDKMPDETQKKAIYTQFKNLLESDEGFQAASNVDKQKVYEINVMLWAMLANLDLIAKEDKNQQAAKSSREISALIFETYTGTSIKKARITSQGLSLN